MLLRKDVSSIAGHKTVSVADYLSSVKTDIAAGEKSSILLPKSDVLVFGLENNSEIVVRPSGTEPKLKCYLTAKGNDVESADKVMPNLKMVSRQSLKIQMNNNDRNVTAEFGRILSCFIR